MNNQDHLQTIREFEIGLVLNLLPKCGSILEIGAGSGWQSLKLSDHGYQVSAIDLAGSPYLDNVVFPIETYDGRHIPFGDQCFDLVFSSNVLEHIKDIEEYQKEILRVLKPGGLALHVLPSGTWRFWTNISHYPYMLRRIRSLTRPAGATGADLGEQKPFAPKKRRTRIQRVLRLHRVFCSLLLGLVPVRHGEFGNALSEIYLFSKYRWLRFFKNNGFEVVACQSNGLFYTGHDILSTRLNIPSRAMLSRVLGSSCNIILLKKA